MQGLELFFQFLVMHAVLDFMLQPSVMASGKNRSSKYHGTADSGFPPWYYWLGAHALGHGGAVYLICGNLWLGLMETALHALIDYGKSEEKMTLAQDQALHLFCKLGYCIYLVA
ncbi:MAG: DUF3307 domain-containing protein [Gammaproteobacteria bacterium]|nr:DUF3307 domain-containing protein [Gammaproteobacteria bacterium]